MIRSFILIFFLTVFYSPIDALQTNETSGKQLPFVILITSYNNENYAKPNIISALSQKYSNFRVIFVNDHSTDNTLKIAKDTADLLGLSNKVLFIDNQERQLCLKNIYEAITTHIQDNEIVVNLDGDDCLANNQVLAFLNKLYLSKDNEIWLTYGQFICLSNNQIGWNIPIPKEVINNCKFREFERTPTHLKTYYAWLFKKIQKKDLLYRNRFFEMTADCAFTYPMLEMCGERIAFVDKITYIYNDLNPLNDHKISKNLQKFYHDHIKRMPKYKRLPHNIFTSCDLSTCFLCKKTKNSEIYLSAKDL